MPACEDQQSLNLVVERRLILGVGFQSLATLLHGKIVLARLQIKFGQNIASLSQGGSQGDCLPG